MSVKKPVRVLIAERNTKQRELLREMVATESDREVVALARDGQEAVQMAMMHAPQVAVVSYDLQGMSGPQATELMTVHTPKVMTVLVVDTASPEVLAAAMRSGARAVLTRPLDPAQLSAKIEELAIVSDRAEPPGGWRFPKVTAITGAKGGVGKSTVAANLAVTLAKAYPGKVALVDMYTQFGDIATMFNIVPTRTIADLAPVHEDTDAESLKNYITVHSSGVHIIAASDSPQPLDAVSAECMDTVLYLLKSRYEYVIVDVPPILHHVTLHVLAHANLVLLIANLFDLTTTADTKKLYDALQAEFIPKENVGIILSRVSKGNRLHTADVERIFGVSALAHIPNDVRLVNSVNDGTPFVQLYPDSPFAQSLRMLAGVITGEALGSEVQSKKGILGLSKWGPRA